MQRGGIQEISNGEPRNVAGRLATASGRKVNRKLVKTQQGLKLLKVSIYDSWGFVDSKRQLR